MTKEGMTRRVITSGTTTGTADAPTGDASAGGAGSVRQAPGRARGRAWIPAAVRGLLGLAVLLLALLAHPGVAGVANADIITNSKFTIGTTFTHPCTGEIVNFTGTVQQVQTLTVDGNGVQHFTFHQSPQLTFVDASGVQYRFVSAFNTAQNPYLLGPVDTLPVVFTIVSNGTIVSEGPAPNFVAQVTQHQTINANGEITAVVVNVQAECR